MSSRKTVPARFLFLLSLFASLPLRPQTELYKPAIGAEVSSAEGGLMARSGPLLTEAQWKKIAPLLPKPPQQCKGGRP